MPYTDSIVSAHPVSRTTIFSTGTDEHGQKVQKAAAAKSLDPLTFCDQISPSFKRLASDFDVQFTRFIRTTDADHRQVASRFWQEIDRKGLIYKKKYEGWYCVSDETFVTSVEDVLVDGKTVKVSAESQNPVEWTTEENYMFKMSSFSDRVLTWLNNNPDVVQPQKWYDMVHKWVSHGLHDLSVSRPRQRLDWGIPVPGDDSHTMYVWMEALCNYLTVAGYGTSGFTWPPSCQVIGKDIIKFHAIYWPAFLMAADLLPPERILTHSHWTIDGLKMSKSKGNVVNPFNLLDVYGSEGVRYYLLREGVLHEDGNFSDMQMKRSINSELSDTLGNLLSRCSAPAVNVDQVVPACHGVESLASSSVQHLIRELGDLPHVCEKHFEAGYFNRGIEEVMRVLRMTNAFVTSEEVWTLVKRKQPERLDACLTLALECVRVAAILLQPVVPRTSARALDKLSATTDQRSWDCAGRQFEKREAVRLSSDSAVLYKKLK